MYDQGFERHVWRGAPRMGHGGWSVECTPAHKPNVHIPGNILNFLKNSNIQELLSAPPVIFGCEDLLLEKYGSAIVGIINRYPPIQHNSLLHNSHAAHAGASTRHLHLSDRKPDNIASRQAAEECLFSRSGDNFEASMDVSGDLGTFSYGTDVRSRGTRRDGIGGLNCSTLLFSNLWSAKFRSMLLASQESDSKWQLQLIENYVTFIAFRLSQMILRTTPKR